MTEILGKGSDRGDHEPENAFVAPKLKVSGVLWAGPKPQAIVNDLVVGIGDVVQGATLAAIRKGEVEFNAQGKNFTVEVQK